MDINTKIAEELGIRKEQAAAAVKLIDEGCTIPFIARYRKEATGALSATGTKKPGEPGFFVLLTSPEGDVEPVLSGTGSWCCLYRLPSEPLRQRSTLCGCRRCRSQPCFGA